MNDIIEIHEDQKKDKGFTLIELLIVIVILGILATVTVFAVSGITNQGQESACDAEYKTVEVALEAYQAQNGNYPADMGALTAAGAQFLRTAPTYYDINGTGGITLATVTGGNPCVLP